MACTFSLPANHSLLPRHHPPVKSRRFGGNCAFCCDHCVSVGIRTLVKSFWGPDHPNGRHSFRGFVKLMCIRGWLQFRLLTGINKSLQNVHKGEEMLDQVLVLLQKCLCWIKVSLEYIFSSRSKQVTSRPYWNCAEVIMNFNWISNWSELLSILPTEEVLVSAPLLLHGIVQWYLCAIFIYWKLYRVQFNLSSSFLGSTSSNKYTFFITLKQLL